MLKLTATEKFQPKHSTIIHAKHLQLYAQLDRNEKIPTRTSSIAHPEYMYLCSSGAQPKHSSKAHLKHMLD